MGWWEDDDGLLLGDDPVDVFEEELRLLRKAREHAGGSPPTFQELLDALCYALSLSAAGFTAEGRKLGPIVAVRRPAEASLRSRRLEPSADLRDAVLRALDRIVKAYQITSERRRPTMGEVLGTIRFSLCVQPERLLAPEPGVKLIRIDEEGEPEET